MPMLKAKKLNTLVGYVDIDNPDVGNKLFKTKFFRKKLEQAQEKNAKLTAMQERMQATLAERRAKKDLDK